MKQNKRNKKENKKENERPQAAMSEHVMMKKNVRPFEAKQWHEKRNAE